MRRAVTVGVAALVVGSCTCARADPQPDGDRQRVSSHERPVRRAPRSAVERRTFEWAESAVGPQRAIVMLPRERVAGVQLPLLVALHGQGEARRGVRRGAWGWLRDYDLERADAALRRGRLTSADFQGLVQPDRLRALSDSLRARPYRGIVVACPYTNDLFADPDIAAPFDRFVIEELLPRLRRDLPVSTDRAGTAIDGVSLGGIQALLVGFAHPETFGAVGGMQPAVRRYVQDLLDRVRQGGTARPAQRIRLVTSTGDRLRDVVLGFSGQLRAASVRHEMLMTEGPHDYVWNRGPGAIEMLLYYDRVLRGEDP